jgi:lipoprotein NlpD
MRVMGLFIAVGLGLSVSGCIPAGVPKGGLYQQTQSSAPTNARIEPAPLATVFDEAPVWESRPVIAGARIVPASEYVVQPGDNLLRIGEKTGAGADAIARVNEIPVPYIIKLGQRLVIPQGRYHRVSAGETGIAIARAYAVPWSRLVDLNALNEPYALRVGQFLLLPADNGTTSIATERAAAFKLDIDDILTGGEPANDVGSVAPPPIASPKRPLAPTVAVREPARFAGSFDWPAYGRLTQSFGPGGAGEINDGVDISVAQNAPILASSDGVVAFVGDRVAGYGGLVLIRHGDGWITAYGRAASATVTRGQSVRRGQIIGRAGSGASPLLHFEMRQNRKPVNPLRYLPAR